MNLKKIFTFGDSKRQKKITITLLSSFVAVSGAAILIIVPLTLTSQTINLAPVDVKLNKVINVYNPSTKDTTLIVDGNNLPSDKKFYSVFNVTNPNSKFPILSNNITLSKVNNNQIVLSFVDSGSSTTPIYSVQFNDGSFTQIEANSSQNIVQPKITITEQPKSQTISSSSCASIVALSIRATVSTQIDGQLLNYQWYSLDANSTWSAIPDAIYPFYMYDITNIPIKTKQHFKCEINYKYAESVMSNVAFIEKVVPPVPLPPPPSTVQEIAMAIYNFNAKSIDQKLAIYNSIMADNKINNKIYNHFFMGGGITNFFNSNVQAPTSSTSLFAYNNFKAFLPTYNVSDIVTPPVLNDNGNNFLSIKGVLEPSVYTSNFDDNLNYKSKYNYQDLTKVNGYYNSYNFFSMAKNSIASITLNDDFSLSIVLSNIEANFAFRIITGDGSDYFFNYNNLITLNDSTLFPGMSNHIKTNILKLT